ncbi:MAG: Rid family detoxifying hydrolase [Bacteroidetes bacterium]|nr:Rid family detoxifying hydrolase [Bacteroidota bacterium]
MPLQVIFTDNAPVPIGPYSQAILVDKKLLFLAGQISLDPKSNQIVGTTIQEQTEQIFNNIEAILTAAGTSLEKVVKTTVYLTNMDNFQAMNEVYEKRLRHIAPARTTLEVSRLPKGALVEIEVLAVIE